MNDEQLRSLLEEGFEAMDTKPRDAERSIHQVMERKAHVRQRSRWWPFPVFYRKAEMPSATEAAEHQPSPVPATDGHSPTVIGRTQSMFSPAKAITAGALVFALGGVVLIAQPFGQQSGGVPGAATDEDRAAPVEFSAKWAFGPPIRPGTSEAVAGVVQERGEAWRPGVLTEASDPRWQGTLSVASNSDDYGAVGGPSVDVFAFRIENEEGAWQQMPTVSLIVPGVDEVDRGVFVGEGEYEGLIAVVDIATDHAAQAWDLHGYIIDGELPPPPEPVISE